MKTVALGDVVDIKGGGTPSKDVEAYWGGDIPWASVKDFKGFEITATVDRITALGVANSATNIVPANSILVPTRMAVGKAAINTIPMAINQDIKALTPRIGVEVRYLLHALLARGPELERQATGATVKGITLEVLKSLQIPLPPLEEQKRIAAILDQADDLRRKRQRALDRLNQLGQAIFIEMFGDLIRNEKTWPSGGTLGDHAEIVSGITKGRDAKGRPTRSVPYLAVVNVQDKRLQLDAPKEIEATEEEILRYRLQLGDLLLTEGGDPDKLGRGTLWNAELPECIHQNHVFRVRLSSKKYNPVFLNWLVGSAYGKGYFLRSAKQTTGIASINMSQLKAFPMLLPPIKIQDDFSDKLKKIEGEVERFTGGAIASTNLFASLQHRAFRGELTATR